MVRRALVLVAASLVSVAAGCASHGPPLPTYPRLSDAESIRVLAERAKSVRTVSGEGAMTLTRPDGESVRLDAAIVSAPPDKVRMRAWKFGQAVFDLTVNESGVYLITPEGSSRKEQIKSAGVSAAQLARTWSLLSGGFFEGAGLSTTDHGDTLELRRQMDGQTVACEVDRSTLTPRRYELIDPQGRTRFSLSLDRYAMSAAGVPWASRMTAVSDGGTIVVTLREVEVNGEIGPDAFRPPRRAEKLP